MKVIAIFLTILVIVYTFHYITVSWKFSPTIRRLVLKNTHEELYRLTRDVLKLLENRIDLWAVGGTAIGVARHGEIIPWDDDVDFACFVNDAHKLEDLEWNTIGAKATFCEIGLQIERNGVNFDIFFCRLRDGIVEYDHDLIRKLYPKETVEFNDIYPIVSRKFGNLQIPTANNIDSQLQRAFGNDFMKKGKLKIAHVNLGPQFVSTSMFLWNTSPFIRYLHNNGTVNFV
jgi:hypothetical protein